MNANNRFKVFLQKEKKLGIVIPPKKQFEQWVKSALLPSTQANEVTIRIVSKQSSAKLNETYRHKSGPTNVLSFSYPAIPGDLYLSLGDLAVCAELVLEEAAEEKKNILAHWAHLTVHGLLHLQGYDHEEKMEAQQMEFLEKKILLQLGFPDPYSTPKRTANE